MNETAANDRRPIAARSHQWARDSARWLAAKQVSPNAISVAGMFGALVSGLALAATSGADGGLRSTLWILSAALVGFRLLCNLLDGMVAVEWGRGTPVGVLYNEIPDRVSDFAILVGAGYSLGGNPTLGYLAATAAILTAYIRATARSVGAPSDFGGPMAKQQRMATIIVTAVVLALIPGVANFAFGQLPGYGLMSVALAVIAAGSAWTAWVRLRRAAAYLWNRPQD